MISVVSHSGMYVMVLLMTSALMTALNGCHATTKPGEDKVTRYEHESLAP